MGHNNRKTQKIIEIELYKQIIGRITLQEFDFQTPNKTGLASHGHEKLYTSRAKDKRKGWMTNKENG